MSAHRLNSPTNYVFFNGKTVGLHRKLCSDVGVEEDKRVELWAALAPSTREALLALCFLMRRSGEWPSAPLCVEVARQFNADAAVVCAGYGYVPRRALTHDEGLAWEVCRQVATASYHVS